jgi:hypothetical protein
MDRCCRIISSRIEVSALATVRSSVCSSPATRGLTLSIYIRCGSSLSLSLTMTRSANSAYSGVVKIASPQIAWPGNRRRSKTESCKKTFLRRLRSFKNPYPARSDSLMSSSNYRSQPSIWGQIWRASSSDGFSLARGR